MEYHGTAGDDVLDQSKLGLADGSVIYGGKGNDTITVGIGTAVGQEGNDRIIGTSPWSTLCFWSPAGVVVNLATGIAQDGYGTIDTLVNIHTVQGTGFDDEFIGGSGNDEFWGLNGSNSYVGGGGKDTVVFWDIKYEDCRVSYDAPTDTFTVKKSAPAGDTGTDTLTGIQTLRFYGPNNYDYQLTKYDSGSFQRVLVIPVALANGAGVNAVKVGDFNGDGNKDIVLVQQVGSGTAEAPIQILLGDGNGSLVNSTASVFSGSSPLVNPGGGRTLIGDFNNDGVSDIFQLEFGNDAPPFPGGRNQLFLSSPASRLLVDVSATLPQNAELNHGGSVGDVNGDGYLDVLVNTLSHGNKLLLNDGTGHFLDRSDLLPHPTFDSFGSQALQSNTYSGILDVNADGHSDLVLGKWDSEASTTTSQVLINDGNGNFTRLSPISLPLAGVYKEIVLDVKAIDLNGDKLPDLALSLSSGGDATTVTGGTSTTWYRTPYIQLLINDGEGLFHDETALRLPQSLVGDSSWINSITVTDLNQDGFADLVAASAGMLPSLVYLNRGDGSFYDAWESTRGGITVAADVNSDGMTDLITYNNASLAINQNRLVNGHVYRANFGGDQLLGSVGDDTFLARDGVDVLDGSTGTDTVVFGVASANYSITQSVTGYVVTNLSPNASVEKLANIERLKFTDKAIALDVGSNEPAGETALLVGAALPGKLYLDPSKLALLGAVIGLFDQGYSLQTLSGAVMRLPIWSLLTGREAPTNTDIATYLLTNVNGMAPAESTLANAVTSLNAETAFATQGSFLWHLAESNANQTHVGLVGLAATGLAYSV